jgi:DNA-binding transcriptional LysR family regulator
VENKLAFSLIVILIIVTLTACGQPPTATPQPTPEVVSVAHTPSLRPVREALHDCAITFPEIALVVHETSFPYLLEESADLFLWLGEPPQTSNYVYPLAREQLVVIVHPDNPIDVLETSELFAIFTGQMRNWHEVSGLNIETEVWVYPKGDGVQQLIDRVVLHDEPNTSWAWLTPDPPAMLEAVSENASTIGFLPRAWLTEKIKIVEVESELHASLNQPLLALANTEPQGGVRKLLFCLQNETGQSTLSMRYQVLGEN